MHPPPTPLKLAIVMSGRRQREIAERIGVDASLLSRWANGLHCRDAATRQAIADELGRNVEDLWPALKQAA